jgi:magnesium transporter
LRQSIFDPIGNAARLSRALPRPAATRRKEPPMLRTYTAKQNRLTLIDTVPQPPDLATVVWFDLVNPTIDETRLVEAHLRISLPTPADMAEIELSDRLYNEDGAEFMTMTALAGLDRDDPVKAPVTFILKDRVLATVRHAEPKPFAIYVTRAQRSTSMPCGAGELVMLGLIEAIIDRTADALERIGDEIDAISHEVFRNKASNATKKTRDLQSLIQQIGRKDDLLTKIQESLVSIVRLAAYHGAVETPERGTGKEGRQRVKLIQRDATSLGDHAVSLSNKVSFLLNATLGLINLEQNQIIKIFSVVAVIFLPPTLVASIYGMNFDFMPELHWLLGYPWALSLMLASAVVPFLFFKRRGWL